MNRTALIREMAEIVRRASDEVMSIYARPIEVSLKEDDSPLTAADMASHHCMVSALEALTPQWPIVSEESGLADLSERRQWQRYWLIDPLDGTKEFVDRNGEFTVNLALIENNRPTLGVVGVPARQQLYLGDVLSASAQRWDQEGEHNLRARRFSGALTIVASRRHGGAALEGALKRLEADFGALDLRSVGSALKICLLAEGQADLYPRLAPTSEWDIAAAQAVLEAAGGVITQRNGEPLQYNKESILNPEFIAAADPSQNWLRYFSD